MQMKIEIVCYEAGGDELPIYALADEGVWLKLILDADDSSYVAPQCAQCGEGVRYKYYEDMLERGQYVHPQCLDISKAVKCIKEPTDETHDQ